MAKGLWLAVVIVVGILLPGWATPIADGLVGVWVNIDPEASGLAQISILPAELGGWNVFGYGVCSPDFCDWGSTTLVLAGMAPDHVQEWGIAIWELDPVMIILTLHLEGEFLLAEVFTYLTDGTGIPMRELALLRHVN